MKRKIASILLIALTGNVMAQDSTASLKQLSWSFFADTYYSYDFSKPANHLKPGFLYNHNRHNEFNINLGLVKAAFNSPNTRANLALMAGTYAQYNLASEPELLRHVYEANVGVKISKNSNLWIDAGIMPSHIGYESAISKDNWTLTRSIAAENSPYYEAGAKISYTSKNEKTAISAMVLNGWQRIQRPEVNNTPAFGTQVIIKPNSKVTLNWSTFVGNDKPDSTRRWRYFNNVYGIFQATDKLGFTLGMDIGQEQSAKGSTKLNIWYTPTFVIRFTPQPKWSIAARGEYYSDSKSVIISVISPEGFKTYGGSLNVDRMINNNFWWRTEIRTMFSKDEIFIKESDPSKNNLSITTSFAISF